MISTSSSQLWCTRPAASGTSGDIAAAERAERGTPGMMVALTPRFRERAQQMRQSGEVEQRMPGDAQRAVTLGEQDARGIDRARDAAQELPRRRREALDVDAGFAQVLERRGRGVAGKNSGSGPQAIERANGQEPSIARTQTND